MQWRRLPRSVVLLQHTECRATSSCFCAREGVAEGVPAPTRESGGDLFWRCQGPSGGGVLRERWRFCRTQRVPRNLFLSLRTRRCGSRGACSDAREVDLALLPRGARAASLWGTCFVGAAAAGSGSSCPAHLATCFVRPDASARWLFSGTWPGCVCVCVCVCVFRLVRFCPLCACRLLGLLLVGGGTQF